MAVCEADARKRHFLAKDKLSDGIDPGEVRKVEKLTRHLVAENSFEAVAREWFNQMMQGWADYLDKLKVGVKRASE